MEKCCICGKAFDGYGHNPWPVVKDSEKKCCGECNALVVIPARMKDIKVSPENKAAEKEL